MQYSIELEFPVILLIVYGTSIFDLFFENSKILREIKTIVSKIYVNTYTSLGVDFQVICGELIGRPCPDNDLYGLFLLRHHFFKYKIITYFTDDFFMD